MMLALYCWKWRVVLLYSGRWDVQRKCQLLLMRKYLSLDEMDAGKIEGVEDSFREAIFSTAPRLSHDAFMSAHYGLGNIWGM
jgi:hypothetical protein